MFSYHQCSIDFETEEKFIYACEKCVCVIAKNCLYLLAIIAQPGPLPE